MTWLALEGWVELVLLEQRRALLVGRGTGRAHWVRLGTEIGDQEIAGWLVVAGPGRP